MFFYGISSLFLTWLLFDRKNTWADIFNGFTFYTAITLATIFAQIM